MGGGNAVGGIDPQAETFSPLGGRIVAQIDLDRGLGLARPEGNGAGFGRIVRTRHRGQRVGGIAEAAILGKGF